MNNDTNLAPCPFCGGSAHREPTGKWCGSFIYCDMCSASINENTEPTAIAAWNHRTTSPVEPVAPILPHPLGWQMLVSEDLERSWLRIAAPNGSEMAFSAERGSLTAQLLQDFGIALDSPPAAPAVQEPVAWMTIDREDVMLAVNKVLMVQATLGRWESVAAKYTVPLCRALATSATPAVQEPVTMAMLFHRIYERLAPEFGYETRVETRTFDPDSPNGKLMIAVCREIYAALAALEAAP
jgi:hypothetical protein